MFTALFSMLVGVSPVAAEPTSVIDGIHCDPVALTCEAVEAIRTDVPGETAILYCCATPTGCTRTSECDPPNVIPCPCWPSG